MKKSLFLLPLLAGLTLCSCGDNGGKGGSDTGDSVTIDFNEIDKEVFPYVADSSAFTFEVGDMSYNCMGCYLGNDRDTGDNYLMMKNKWGDDKYAKEGEYAFFGNAEAFPSPIKSVELTINGSSSSASTVYRVTIMDSAAEQAVLTGGKTGKKGQTVTATSSDKNGYYFAISTNPTSGKIYNGQILKVVVSF